MDYQGFDSWSHGRKSLDILSPLELSASDDNDKAFMAQSMVRASKLVSVM